MSFGSLRRLRDTQIFMPKEFMNERFELISFHGRLKRNEVSDRPGIIPFWTTVYICIERSGVCYADWFAIHSVHACITKSRRGGPFPARRVSSQIADIMVNCGEPERPGRDLYPNRHGVHDFLGTRSPSCPPLMHVGSHGGGPGWIGRPRWMRFRTRRRETYQRASPARSRSTHQRADPD
jgi:hypothetical protein